MQQSHPLPVLRDKVGRIDDLRVQRIAQLFSQRAPDHFECLTFVMAFQILDVLQHEGCWAVVHQDAQGFVAQIGSFKDSLRESSVITDCHEQLDTDDV